MQVQKLALAVFFRINGKPSQEIKAGLAETDNAYILKGCWALVGQQAPFLSKLVGESDDSFSSGLLQSDTEPAYV